MILKGILKSFDAATYKAKVQLIGSFVYFLEDVSVSRAIPAAEMVAERYCAIVVFSSSNFADGVLFAIYTV